MNNAQKYIQHIKSRCFPLPGTEYTEENIRVIKLSIASYAKAYSDSQPNVWFQLWDIEDSEDASRVFISFSDHSSIDIRPNKVTIYAPADKLKAEVNA